MKVNLVLNCGLYSKMGKWGLSRKRDNVLNSGYVFENGKPDIVFKTVKGFNIKRTPFIILILENSFKLGIVALVGFNTMLVMVFIIDFYSQYGSGSQKPSLPICSHF